MSDYSPATLSPEFQAWLQAHPQANVHAIIRLQALTPEVEKAVTDAGCRVYRRLQLLPSLAVEAPASTLMALAAEPWVQRIEPDQEVRAL